MNPLSPGSSPAPEAPGAWVIDADARNFEREIIQRSLTTPVLVDFWATWCGPCKTLGPELEKRAREGQGRFVLAKVDIDKNPELAQVFRVQAVPTVLAIVGGRLVDGFQGALPAAEIDEFLARVVPGGPAPSRTDLRVERALVMAEQGELEQATGLLREILRDEPEHAGARFALIDVLIKNKKSKEARLLLEALSDEGPDAERKRALLAELDFAEAAGDQAEFEAVLRANPDDHGARIRLAKALIAAKEHGAGLEHLLTVVRGDAGEARAEAKKAMLEVFAMLGLEDKLANEYRFKLSLELFV